MIINRTFYNIKCDHCGALIDEETWWDEKNVFTTDILNDCNWIKCEGDRHYCDNCWEYDDDDNIVTKDGRKWDGDTHKEILTYRLHYLDDMDETLTLTQFRIKQVRAMALFRSMVGTLYKGMLADDLEITDEIFRRMIAERYGSDEYKCYQTFLHNGIFQLIEDDYYTNKSKA
jgi:hypothetical protein